VPGDRSDDDSQGAGTASSAGLRVLVVDDHVDGAEMLAAMLGLSGHQTRTAHNGPDALAEVRAFRPEIVFLDIGLPGMSGYDVARQIRSDSTLVGSVLVALTGWGSEDDKRRTKEAGFDFHLTKPVETAALDDVLRRYVVLRSGPATRGR